jgi:hypothetical protein
MNSNGNFNVTDIRSYIAINKKVCIEVGIQNTGNQYTDTPIFWFPQGVYIIKDASVAESLNSITLSISLNDKMALLNGECGGLFNSGITLSPMAEYNSNTQLYEEKPVHVRAILTSLLTIYG